MYAPYIESECTSRVHWHWRKPLAPFRASEQASESANRRAHTSIHSRCMIIDIPLCMAVILRCTDRAMTTSSTISRRYVGHPAHPERQELRRRVRRHLLSPDSAIRSLQYSTLFYCHQQLYLWELHQPIALHTPFRCTEILLSCPSSPVPPNRLSLTLN